ncbi:AAA family ATPase [Fundidesulfovibrio magnetotacticus]|nr:AAA family ATPase [Fundidesulfovibrio magnetotacticus]
MSLIVLDPLSRFFGGNENDNTLATAFCQLLEKLAKETGAAVVCCHHVAKGVGQTPRGFNLEAALSQEAMRGASGLTGAARWQSNIVAMPAKAAKEEIDDPDAKNGVYLAAQVSKKNYGPPESKFFLRRGAGGILLPVKNRRLQDLDLERVLKEKAYALVKSREEEGEKPLTLKGIGDIEPARWKREGLKGATKVNVRQAIAVAIREERLFEVVRYNPGNHRNVTYLATAPDAPRAPAG